MRSIRGNETQVDNQQKVGKVGREEKLEATQGKMKTIKIQQEVHTYEL